MAPAAPPRAKEESNRAAPRAAIGGWSRRPAWPIGKSNPVPPNYRIFKKLATNCVLNENWFRRNQQIIQPSIFDALETEIAMFSGLRMIIATFFSILFVIISSYSAPTPLTLTPLKIPLIQRSLGSG